MTSKAAASASRKLDRKVNRLRNGIIGAVLVLAAVVIGAGIYYTTGATSGEFVAGTHYTVIEGAKPRKPGQPITVQEFFSYGCVHCRNFDSMLDEWLEAQADDVRFERIPATFSPAWTILAQSYYALQQLGALERNHERLFGAIHDTGRQFLTIEAVADFVDGAGTTRDAFLAAANGPQVAERLRNTERAQRASMISGVPSLVVAGRYVVGMSEGRQGALDVMDYLVTQVRSGVEIPAATAAGAPAEAGTTAAKASTTPAEAPTTAAEASTTPSEASTTPSEAVATDPATAQ